MNHPDLQSNIWTNPGEIAGDGIDNDGNGFVDDVNGWDFNESIANVSDSDGHGTMVSGVIGMVGNNNTSGIGVAPDVQIMSLKVGDHFYTSTSIIAGIHYAVNLKTGFDINICAINASFGGMCKSTVYVSAIEKALDAGIMIVAAAGNDVANNDLSVNYNNRYDNLIVVAATDANDNLSSFSNYGVKSVDLAAPGSSVFTTIGMGTTSVNGTSLAAPMVTAAVALLASAHPDWTPAMIKEAILATVDVLPSLEGKVASGGRLNIGDAINYDAAKKPDAPSDLSVLLRADGSFELKWSDNSKNETSFELQYRRDGGTWTTAYSTISRNTQSTNFISSLAGTYDFRIRAVHSSDASDWSNMASIVKDNSSPPSSPTGLVTSMVNDGLSLSWNTVSGATAYRLERSFSGQNQWSVVYEGSDNSFSDTGVGSGVRYDYRVYAICDGIASAASAVRSQDAPYRTPATPTGVTVTQLNADTVQFIWSDVQYAESYLIERYDTRYNRWVEAATTTVATFTDTKLKASTSYSYRITAKNALSSEPTETIVVTTLPPVSKAPTSLKAAVKGFTYVTLTWKAAAGATAYRVEMSMTGKNDSWVAVSSTSAASLTVDGLTAKTKYYFRIFAVSDSGESKASSKLTVTTAAVPLAKITTSGYAMSPDGQFGVKLRITTPQQNDNKKTPVLPSGTAVSYELIVAGDKAKTDKTTGLLIDGINLGAVAFTETTLKNKTYSDSSVILFSDIARIENLTKMKTVQFQLLTTYTLPDGTTITSVATKVAKLTLPKWFA